MICGSSTLFSQKPTVNFEENEEVQVIGSWEVLIKGRGGGAGGGGVEANDCIYVSLSYLLV